YHFVSPAGVCHPFDPNGAIFWKGRYHLMYIFQNEKGHCWGHVSSTDLLHWRHHPPALEPGEGDMGIFSGGASLDKNGVPTITYWGLGNPRGICIATSTDDLIETWTKSPHNPVIRETAPGLGDDNTLRIRPPEELALLRYNPRKVENLVVPADGELPLEGVAGNSIELAVQMAPEGAGQFGLKLCSSPGGEEQTLVFYDAAEKKLKIDTTKSSLGEGPKSVEAGPFELKPGEPLKLRVFVDRSVVEVFANDRQAVMRRIYPTRRDSLGVALFSRGGSASVKRFEAWDMAAANPW
ncbi:MAG: glycoside hydrolase family 32 protein, partial [Planctomycetota bacterium]